MWSDSRYTRVQTPVTQMARGSRQTGGQKLPLQRWSVYRYIGDQNPVTKVVTDSATQVVTDYRYTIGQRLPLHRWSENPATQVLRLPIHRCSDCRYTGGQNPVRQVVRD